MRSVSTWFHSTNDDRADDGVLVLGHLVQISVVITVFLYFHSSIVKISHSNSRVWTLGFGIVTYGAEVTWLGVIDHGAKVLHHK
jgi:hypothetical protein